MLRSNKVADIQGNMKVLDWLASKGILPNTYGANDVLSEGLIKVLNWMASKGVLPDVEGANRVSELGKDMLEWLKKHNIFPDIKGAERALMAGQIDTLHWIEKERNLYLQYLPEKDTQFRDDYIKLYINKINNNTFEFESSKDFQKTILR